MPPLSVSPAAPSIQVPEWERTTKALTVSNNAESGASWSLHGGSGQEEATRHASQRELSDSEALRREVQQQGRAQVIAKLDAAAKPEVELDEQAKQTQRQEITRLQQDVLESLDGHAVSVWTSQHEPIITAEVDAEGMERLLEHEAVRWVKKDQVDELHLSDSSELIGTPQAHEMGYSGAEQTIAVLDAGIDSDHPFLSESVIGEACFSTHAPAQDIDAFCPDGSEQLVEGERLVMKRQNLTYLALTYVVMAHMSPASQSETDLLLRK